MNDPRNAEAHATVLGTGIQRQLKPGGPKGIEGSTPSGGTLEPCVRCPGCGRRVDLRARADWSYMWCGTKPYEEEVW